MLKHLKMALLALAAACLIVFSVLPHHHHDDGSICFVLERCTLDGQINDIHTGHHDTHHEDVDHPCKMDVDKVAKAFSVHNPMQSVQLLLVAVLPDFFASILPAVEGTRYRHCVELLLTPPHGRSFGLRA